MEIAAIGVMDRGARHGADESRGAWALRSPSFQGMQSEVSRFEPLDAC